MSDTPRSRGGLSLTAELEELDRSLAALLARRAQLLARSASARRAKGLKVSEAEQERRLWTNFETACKASGLDLRLARQLFTQANSLAYRKAVARDDQNRQFLLAPPRGEIEADFAGPVSLTRIRYHLVLAALTGSPSSMGPAVMCDATLELVKALNQLGAGVSWEGATLSNRAHEPLSFEGKKVYAGENEANLHLLAALAATQAGRCTVSGGPALKSADLGPAARVLRLAGARLASIDTRSMGLPARLEAGGEPEATIELPADCPPSLAGALALAAPFFESGATLAYGPQLAPAVDEALAALADVGIHAERVEGRARIPAGKPVVSAEPALPLDPVLCAHLLAMPAFRGGNMRLIGRFGESGPHRLALDVLAAAGLDVEASGGAVTSRRGARPAEVAFEPGLAELVPLCLALALDAPTGAAITLPDDFSGLDAAREMCSRLGRNIDVSAGRLTVAPGAYGPWEEAWEAPDAFFALGAALLSLSKPGIVLENPAVALSLWPGFWKIYNLLPAVDADPWARKEPKDDQEKRGRRIRID